jgi:hypothetical protein
MIGGSRRAGWFRRALTVALVCGLGCAGFGPGDAALADTRPAAGVPATVSADVLPTWQINGVVWSQVVVNNTVYATGSFTKARPPGVAAGGAGEVTANNIFAYDITTGNRVSSFSHSLNAQGRSVAASPDGTKLYVGGDFTTVDGQARGHIAQFDLPGGTLNTTFKPSLNGGGRALATAGSTVYAGGPFTAVNGTARTRLAAFNSGGVLQSWAPKVDNGQVWSMVVAPDASRVIVGGSFTTLNGGTAALGMGSISTTTAALMPWAANTVIKNSTSGAAITSLRTDGTQIYGSGYAFGAGNFEGTFAANPTTGNITLLNDCHGDTYDVLPIGPVLYSVGHPHDCSWIRSYPDTSPRVRWQRALAQTIAPTTTNRGPDNFGWNYNGRPASSVLQWFPQLAAGSFTGQSQGAWSLAGNDSYVALGGEFPKINGIAQQGLARMAVSAIAPNKMGPTYTTNPPRTVPPTTATRTASGTIKVTYGTAWDYDNESLTYELLRNGTVVTAFTRSIKTNFWTVPGQTYTDTGLTPGTSYVYQVRIKDLLGNTLLSPKSSAVTA